MLIGLYFQCDIGWHSIQLDIAHLEQGEEDFLPNSPNLLSMPKVLY